MILFKYFAPTPLNISLLRRGEIFFATTGELNDPTDLQLKIVFRGRDPLWSNIARHVYETAWAQIPHKQLVHHGVKKALIRMMQHSVHRLGGLAGDKTVDLNGLITLFEVAAYAPGEKSTPVTRAILSTVKSVILTNLSRRIEQRNAAACFTTSALSPAMWSIYADKGRGFSVAYSLKSRLLKINSVSKQFIKTKADPKRKKASIFWFEKTHELKLLQAKYTKDAPEINGFDELCGDFLAESNYDVKHYKKCLRSLLPVRSKYALVAKHPSWNGETEFRALLKRSSRDYAGRTMSVSPHQILAVILGSEISRTDSENIVAATRSLVEHQQETNKQVTIPVLKTTTIQDKLALTISCHGACFTMNKLKHVGYLSAESKLPEQAKKIMKAAHRKVVRASLSKRKTGL